MSGWDTSNAISMNFAFWGCKGLTRLAVENWNVSNVENFDHLFAHCNNLVVDVTNWKTSSKCKYYTAMFHTNANEYLDVSGFDTSGAISMALMFEANVNLKKIKGLENFDTSNVVSFEEMFFNCWNLEELDLSNFDTRKADIITPVRSDGTHPSNCTYFMLNGCRSLKKITLGENFTFAGDGTATGNQIGTLPVQNDTYIDGADGNWYTLDGTAYAPADIPNLTAATYYASPIIVKEVIWDRDSKKYMHLSAMKIYQNLQNIAIDSKMNELKKIFLAKNQGASNVGKILVVGTDGNLTLADMPEGGASGDVTGVLDEENNILLSGNLVDGTYTLKFENTDGTYTEIGTLEVGAIPEPEPTKTNFAGALTVGRLSGSASGNVATDAPSGRVTDFVSVQNDDIVSIEGYNHSPTASSVYPALMAFDTSKTKIFSPKHIEGLDGEGYVVLEEKTDTGGIIKIVSNSVAYIRFAGIPLGAEEDIVVNIKRNGEWL